MKSSLLLKSYRKLSWLATPFVYSILRSRLKRGKEHAERYSERTGRAKYNRPEGSLVWLHGASVGETLTILPIVEHLVERGFYVLVTSGTLTSAQLMENRLPRGAIHQFIPLDAPGFVDRFLDHWQPDLALFAESELWPNLIFATKEREIPLVLINARMSERSYKGWKRWGFVARHLLECFDLCLAQSKEDADRLTNLGAIRVINVGNLKYDLPPPLAKKDELVMLQNAIGFRKVIIAASTHPGEEEYILKAHMALRGRYPELLTILAPRHPDRGDALANECAYHGLVASQRSRGYKPDSATDVYIFDTIGEMGLVYRLSTIVFMGGSLVAHGGQNPIEPAKIGASLLHGPHVHNFKEAYEILDKARGAIMVRDGTALLRGLEIFLENKSVAMDVARAARDAVNEIGGALKLTLEALDPYLVAMHFHQHRAARKGRKGT